MTSAAPVPDTVTVHIPFRLVKRGGRKEMQLPDESLGQRKMDNTLLKAVARAHRWKRMLATENYTTVKELAHREGIAFSYMTRVLRLTLLAPEIVEAILNGQHSRELKLSSILDPFPMDWDAQTAWFKEHRRD